jgi:hypothetical protein
MKRITNPKEKITPGFSLTGAGVKSLSCQELRLDR